MSQRDDTTLLKDMLDHATLAIQAAQAHSRPDLDDNPVLRAACERFLEIVGEAAGKVSESTRERLTDVPWSKIVGTRNILVHGYMQIDLDILWNILQHDLPPLIRQLKSALGEEETAS